MIASVLAASGASAEPAAVTALSRSTPVDDASDDRRFDDLDLARLGVPLPLGAELSPRGQGDPVPGEGAGVSLSAEIPGRAGSPSNPVPGTRRTAPAQRQPPATLSRLPLAPEAAGDGWSIVTSPDRPWQTPNYLNSVTCLSAVDCWAVGYYHVSSAQQTLVQHWDGAAWGVVDSPNTSATQHNYLSEVACVSASDCWAVGRYYTGTAYQTLIERWDGESWAIVGSPNANTITGALENVLSGVTCVSASECWAVGYAYTGDTVEGVSAGVYQTLIERWDGSSWTIVSSPTAAGSSLLNAVKCVAASDCWAVGYYYTESGVSQNLIERWDGESWSIADSADTSAEQGNFLHDITCVSASDCWTVGYYADYSDGIRYQTLTTRWDGRSWAVVSSPNTTGHNVLATVACVSTSDCWAIGYHLVGSVVQALAQRWDGASWSLVSSRDTGAEGSVNGVTCVRGSGCWAVGSYSAGPTVSPRRGSSSGTEPRGPSPAHPTPA